MADNFLLYPKAFIALGAGDLVQVTNFNLKVVNNAKKKTTLRQPDAGYTMGTREATLTFDLEVNETGVERDYLNMIFSGTVQNVRIKLPGGETRQFTGVATSETLDQPLDDALKVSIEMTGKVERT